MSTPLSGRPFEILLVEGNPGDVRLAREALSHNEIKKTLSVVRDGAEALDFLHRSGRYDDAPRPDLILLDLNLPRRNGLEVLAEIKDDPELRRIPVAMMTISHAPRDVVKSYDLHANCYVTKPVDFQEFMDIVRSVKDFWLRSVELPGRHEQDGI